MSAFLCSDQHLNYMVNAYAIYCTRGLVSTELVEMGRMLREENLRSVRHRYPQGDHVALPFDAFRFVHVDVVTTLKAVACYEYQSCEHFDEWERSSARLWCRALEAEAIRRLPGYDEAPWGIEEWQPAKIGLRALFATSLRAAAER